MESSKEAWDDVEASVGGLGKALSKRFKQGDDAEAAVTDEQLKGEAKDAGRAFLGALSATADEVGGRLSQAFDGNQTGAAPPPTAPPAVDPTTLPPPAAPPSASPSATGPAGAVDPSTLPPPAAPPASSTSATEPAGAVDPTTLPPPVVDDSST